MGDIDKIFALTLIAAAVACGEAHTLASSEQLQEQDHTAQGHQQLVANGGFDSGNLTPWVMTQYTRGMLPLVPPVQLSQLANTIAIFDANVTHWAGGGGNVLSGLSPDAPVRFPRYGSGAALLNELTKNNHGSALSANFIVTQDDYDEADAVIHHRFVYAPMFYEQIPPHPPAYAPFFFAQLTNQSRGGKPVGTFFQYSEQPGLPWRSDSATPAYRYTDWQIVDFALSPNDVALGDTLNIVISAAGCGYGGHFGEAYVDAFGAKLPGLAIAATGPTTANDNEVMHYAMTITNNGNITDTNVNLSITLSANTTFVAIETPQGLNCTTPNVGQNGNVLCHVAAVGISDVFSLGLDVTTAVGATGVVTMSDYTLWADQEAPLLGPALSTTLTHNVVHGDLSVTTAPSANTAGQNLIGFDVVYKNLGPAGVAGATIFDIMPPGLTPVSWSCAAQGNASCNNQDVAGARGAMQGYVSVDSGAELQCVVLASINGGCHGTIDYSAAIYSPNGVVDPYPANNTHTFIGRADYIEPSALGQACVANSSCASSFCADGVCCDTSCQGTCNACALPGLEGTCSFVAKGEPWPNHGTCGAYVCDGVNGCLTGCSSPSDCAKDFACRAGACIQRLKICKRDADCDAGTYCAPNSTCQAPEDQSLEQPNWLLKGAGLTAYSCATTNSSSPLTFLGAAGIVLRALWRRRRLNTQKAARTRSTGTVLLVLGLTVAGSAQAATDTSLPSGRFVPQGGLNDVWNMPSASVPEGITLGGTALAHYGRDLVRLVAQGDNKVGRDLVFGQGVLDVALALGYQQRVELAVSQSLTLQQYNAMPFMSESLAHRPPTFRWSDLRLQPKINLYHSQSVAVAALAALTLPTGARASAMGYGRFTATPQILAQYTFVRGARVLASVGYGLRPRRVILNADLHNAVTFGAALDIPFIMHKELFAARATVVGEVGIGQRRAVANPIEAHAGMAWQIKETIAANAGLGTGLTNGYGAARWRVLVGLAITPSWRRKSLRSQDLDQPTWLTHPLNPADSGDPAVPLDPGGTFEGPPAMQGADAASPMESPTKAHTPDATLSPAPPPLLVPIPKAPAQNGTPQRKYRHHRGKRHRER